MSYDWLYELEELLDVIYEVMESVMGITSIGIWGVALAWSILVAVVSAIVGVGIALVCYLLEAFPVYKVAKKAGRKSAWLAWVPIFPSLFRLYVLSDVAGDKPVEIKLFGKQFSFKNRTLVFWSYVGIGVFGAELLTIVLGILSVIPAIGQLVALVGSLLYLIPPVLAGFIEYIYLRDVLNKFQKEQSSNRKTAIIVTILDNVCTLGFARVVILYTLLKKDVLPEPIVDAQVVE